MRIVMALVLMMLGIFILAIQDDAETPRQQAASVIATDPPGREAMQLPLDYQETLVQYATVRRSDGFYRNLYISPPALEAIRKGEALPERTIVLIELFDAAGRFDPEIHMAEARSTWQIADLAASSRVGHWNFAAFNAMSGAVAAETDLNDCFSCHESAANRNFLFSNPLLEAFAQTGEVQLSYCPRPGRAPC